MPVFLLLGDGASHVAAHPSHGEEIPAQPQPDPVLTRVGTAHRHADGGYVIDLVAVPLTGRLLLRPPTADDSPHLRSR